MIRVIDALLPVIHFRQPCSGNDASIDLGWSRDIKTCNRFSLCHAYSLLLAGTTSSVRRKHPHPAPVKTSQVSFDEPADKHPENESTTANHPETQREHVQVAAVNWRSLHRYREPCPKYPRF